MIGLSFCKAAFVFCAAVMVGGLRAGAAAKADPVAEGYPDWQGLSAKSYICGREICPSDLRHKVTVVLEVEPNEKLQEQLLTAGVFPGKTGLASIKEIAGWPNKWQSFFGNVPEAQRPAALLKALEKGRSGKPAPLKAVEDALLKESKNLIAQNGALTLDLKVDELIATIPFKVQGS